MRGGLPHDPKTAIKTTLFERRIDCPMLPRDVIPEMATSLSGTQEDQTLRRASRTDRTAAALSIFFSIIPCFQSLLTNELALP
jgi:hypothetical protein